ncbi:hypothetical protein PVAP13_6KG154200 [Panicum virgatum]|uniref:Uncharacterized protein n=1 Tax=Panicum virgatum TaxID=38727 RepID=A0A8T0REH3_PANVG|nr:hypothetical protein PVAP13_6KG154200 [Panicum virgatum]
MQRNHVCLEINHTGDRKLAPPHTPHPHHVHPCDRYPSSPPSSLRPTSNKCGAPFLMCCASTASDSIPERLPLDTLVQPLSLPLLSVRRPPPLCPPPSPSSPTAPNHDPTAPPPSRAQAADGTPTPHARHPLLHPP